jgi:hypothetical protein
MEPIARYLMWFVAALFGAFALVIVSASSAKADSLVVTGFAWHAAAHNRGEKNANYNEVNPGLGYEYDVDADHGVAVGFYQNSFYKHSNYLLWSWQPAHLDTAYGDWKAGFYTGAVTGYHEGEANFVVLPTVSYTYKGVGFNLAILPVPPISQKGIAALQFKWGF